MTLCLDREPPLLSFFPADSDLILLFTDILILEAWNLESLVPTARDAISIPLSDYLTLTYDLS